MFFFIYKVLGSQGVFSNSGHDILFSRRFEVRRFDTGVIPRVKLEDGQNSENGLGRLFGPRERNSFVSTFVS